MASYIRLSGNAEIIMARNERDACSEIGIREDLVADIAGRMEDRAFFDELSARFKSLSHPTRLSILRALSVSECCVCELTRALDQPFSTVSRHLCQLRGAGWVRNRQEGRKVYYALARPEFRRILDAPPGGAVGRRGRAEDA